MLATQRVRVTLGQAIGTARKRRGLTLRWLAERAGVSVSTVHAAESGAPASLETYARLAVTLGLRPQFELVDPRRRTGVARAEDPVHAAMGELEAHHLRGLGSRVAIDEPYQHFQFAGRADLLAWRSDPAGLLHVENRTLLPNVQEVAGSYNAKRVYLPESLATRMGIRRWASVTHVMAVLWSAEAIHAVRLRRATFTSLCPDPLAALEAWWSGGVPEGGVTSALVFLDPALQGARRSLFRGLAALDVIRPRHRDYADALAALRACGRA